METTVRNTIKSQSANLDKEDVSDNGRDEMDEKNQ